MLLVGGESLLFAGGAGNCASTAANAAQPGVSTEAANSIPANYLKWFQRVGLQYNVPWTILAGIGKVESDDGRTNAARRDPGHRLQRLRRGRADADRHRRRVG